MTTTAPTAPIRTTAAARRLLEVDAGASGVLGLALAALPAQVADLLGTSGTTVLRWLGVALLVLAADLALLARTRHARRAVVAAGVGSVAWELASLVVAAVAGLSAAGTVLVVAQGLAFGVLGVLQLRAGRA